MSLLVQGLETPTSAGCDIEAQLPKAWMAMMVRSAGVQGG